MSAKKKSFLFSCREKKSCFRDRGKGEPNPDDGWKSRYQFLSYLLLSGRIVLTLLPSLLFHFLPVALPECIGSVSNQEHSGSRRMSAHIQGQKRIRVFFYFSLWKVSSPQRSIQNVCPSPFAHGLGQFAVMEQPSSPSFPRNPPKYPLSLVAVSNHP